MKYKQKVDFYIALILVFIGIVIISLPLFKITSIKHILIGLFSIYGLINLVQYLLTKESNDYEGMHTFIASLITLVLCTLIDNTKPSNIAMILMAWIIINALIKLKKMDYYHDRNDRMWKIQLLVLILFITTGLLTSLNLANDESVQVLLIGFFMFINGILDLIDPIVKTLIQHK